jgi:hypothetical protein
VEHYRFSWANGKSLEEISCIPRHPSLPSPRKIPPPRPFLMRVILNLLQEASTVMRKLGILFCGCVALIVVSAFMFSNARTEASVSGAVDGEVAAMDNAVDVVDQRIIRDQRLFEVEILVDGRPLNEYDGRGKTYVEAIAGAEYEVRVRNPLPYRVAVALSVDGLNSIDARHTSAWNASKWVIEPYGTINISGWQMSSERARRFYFTSERDSYGAKLGQTANLGLVTAVFFRERRPYPVPVTPPPYPRPLYEEDGRLNKEPAADSSGEGARTKSKAGSSSASTERQRAPVAQPQSDDEYAATGIGRSVQNDVRWVNMELDSQPAGQVTIRYEYYAALVRLGILPRRYERPDPLRRREGARGFEDRRFSPEP